MRCHIHLPVAERAAGSSTLGVRRWIVGATILVLDDMEDGPVRYLRAMLAVCPVMGQRLPHVLDKKMNPKSVKKHICEELAHGRPIQHILNPPCPQIEVDQYDDAIGATVTKLVDDPGWIKPLMPDWNIVVQWLKDDEGFRADYEHAMKYGAIYLADEMLILKDRLLLDPKSASAYKTAMEMIKTSAMWRDPKYSDRVIQDINAKGVPQDPDAVNARIKQLEEELDIRGTTVDMGAVQEVPKKKEISERMRLHLEGARAKRAAKIAEKRKAK